MFTDKANFAGIVDSPPLQVGQVIQKAFIEVNEEGSEAAAATGESYVFLSTTIRFLWQRAIFYSESILKAIVNNFFLIVIKKKITKDTSGLQFFYILRWISALIYQYRVFTLH